MEDTLEVNLLEDVSKLTTIPKEALDKLSSKFIWCLGDSIQEMLLKHNNMLKADIGIGNIIIINEDELIKYKFIPKEELEDAVRELIVNNRNPLKYNLDKTLANKIINTYKDII